jgi:ATP-binding cassette subfamily F protein uup
MTNDLDLDTIEAVEAMLQSFDGVVLMTGHDRAFMDTLAQHIFVFEGDGRVTDWQGSYSELRVAQKAREAADSKPAAAAAAATPSRPAAAAAPAAAAPSADPAADKEARRIASNAKNKIPKVEASLEKVEAEIAALDEALVAACADAGKALELSGKRAAAAARQDELYAEYERLDALVAAGGL